MVLNWPEDGRLRPKHVAKYNLIVIIATCLDVCCVLTVRNVLFRFDNTQRDGISLSKKNLLKFPSLHAKLCINSYSPDRKRQITVRFTGHSRTVVLHYGTRFMPPFCRTEFEDTTRFLDNLWTPALMPLTCSLMPVKTVRGGAVG